MKRHVLFLESASDMLPVVSLDLYLLIRHISYTHAGGK